MLQGMGAGIVTAEDTDSPDVFSPGASFASAVVLQRLGLANARGVRLPGEGER